MEALGVSKIRFSVAFLLLALAVLTESLGLVLFMPILSALDAGSGAISLNTINARLPEFDIPIAEAILAVFVLFVIRSVINYISLIHKSVMDNSAKDWLRTTILEIGLKSKRKERLNFGPGKYSQVLSAEIDKAISVYGAILKIATLGSAFIVALVVASIVSIKATLIGGVLLFGAVALRYFLNLNTTSLSRDVTKKFLEFTNASSHRITNNEIININNLSNFCLNQGRKSSRNIRDSFIKIDKNYGKILLVIEPLLILIGLLFLWLALDVFKLGLAEIVVLGLVGIRLIPAFRGILLAYENISACAGSIEACVSVVSQTSSFYALDSREIHELENSDVRMPSLGLTGLRIPIGDRTLNFDRQIFFEKGINLITGDSGSGKTSLLNVLVGTSEGLFTGGIDFRIQRGSKRPLLRYLPQDVTLPDMSLRVFFEQIGGKKFDHHDIRRVFETLGLHDFWDFFSIEKELNLSGQNSASGGESRRVALAAMVLARPQFLILDEPTTGIHRSQAEKIFKWLRSRIVSDEICIVMTSHDRIAREYADVIWELSDGQLVKSNERK